MVKMVSFSGVQSFIQERMPDRNLTRQNMLKRITFSFIFIVVAQRAIFDTTNFVSHNFLNEDLGNISQYDLYLDIVTNIFTMFSTFMILKISNFSFINGIRLISIFVLEIYNTIMHYAIEYVKFGLLLHGAEGPVSHSYIDSIYFSVITWTTVGFGDVTPPQELKIFVASEALLGQLSQSIAIAAVAYIFATWFGFLGQDKELNDLKNNEDVEYESNENISHKQRYVGRAPKLWRDVHRVARLRRRRMTLSRPTG